MNQNLRRHAARGIALAFLTALVVSVAGGLRRFLANRRENRRLSQKVAEAEVLLSRKRSLLTLSQKNDDWLEGEARRQLGLIGEGEIEFRFVSEDHSGVERMDLSPARESGNPPS